MYSYPCSKIKPGLLLLLLPYTVSQICTFAENQRMSGFLFNEIVFGPVKSRRFGVSLGINLLPETMKYCSFNCIYCECGLTVEDQEKHVKLLPAGELEHAIRQRFEALKLQGLKPDNITFAGNGEPTMHPGFPAIIDLTVELRNRYFPESQITVLSNSTRLHIPAVKEALMKIDNNVLKLDAGSELMYRRINRPSTPVTLAEIVEQLAGFKGNLIVQSLFLKGSVNGEPVDNTTPEEIRLWKEHIVKIKPSLVMLYSFSRETPEKELQRISKETLQQIAGNLEGSGIPCEVFD